MTAVDLELRDSGVELRPESARVVVNLFLPGESTPGSTSRAEKVASRVLALPREEINAAAHKVATDFEGRHDGFASLARADAAKVHPDARDLDQKLAIVLGTTFMAEYAVEGVALCNPSAMVDPDQSGVSAGQLRVIVALRSIGEGHVSSISFCSAVIGPGRDWSFEPRRLPLERATISAGRWDVGHLQRSLEHEGQLSEVSHAVLQKLTGPALSSDVERAIGELPAEFFGREDARGRVETIRRVAWSAYEAAFAPGTALSQRVLLPATDEERHGMEDARFARFVEDDGSVEYRASYTAYDGRAITSRLIVTRDFESFSVHRLIGPAARTKGMAFFPRRVGGRILALTRTDGESILLAASPDGLEWTDEVVVHAPREVWEIVQSGNCGPPIETDRGWLVITHGVGPMRRYSLGAILLDLDDPSRVIARLESPLLEPSGSRQNGHVPNVVYSCGALVHDGVLWLPYGIGDDRVRVASMPVGELLDAMSPVRG